MDCWIVDAFTDAPFAGNQAAIVLLDPADARVSDASWMQGVANDFNLAETAFLVPLGHDTFSLRWFTPTVEVVLCGHATLASAHQIWASGRSTADELAFVTRQSGTLSARRDSSTGMVTINLPADPPTPDPGPPGLAEALGVQPTTIARARENWLVEVGSADEVRKAAPDMRALAAIEGFGVILTAAGDGPYDTVSRYFVPSAGIDEDPVTGSAHCAIAPWWEERLGRTPLRCYQASKRGGEMIARVEGDRVLLEGRAVTIMAGSLLS